MAVITISRQFGAGGRTLGLRLAQRLGYRYVNEDMIKEVATEVNVTPDGVHHFEKEGGTLLTKVVNIVVSGNFIERILAGSAGHLNEETYVGVVRAIIEGLYDEGNVVIIGRGGQYVLRDKPDAYHILLVGDDSFRVDFICAKHGTTRYEGHRVMQAQDKTRDTFLRCFAKENHDNPLLYHLTVNTARVGLEKTEDMIVDLIGSGEGAAEPITAKPA